MSKLVIGIDQSYAETGIGLAVDSQLLLIRDLELGQYKSKTEKRNALKRAINAIVKANVNKHDEIEIIVERIRTNSPTKGAKFGIRPDYLKATGALIAVVVDIAFEYGIPVYSVDTRSWKSKIVPKEFKVNYPESKFLKPEKMPTVAYIKSLGFDVYKRDKNKMRILVKGTGKNAGKIKFADDKCDAGCIALYGFHKDRLLSLED